MPARLGVRPHTAVAWRPQDRGWGLSSQARSSGPALPPEPPRPRPFTLLAFVPQIPRQSPALEIGGRASD